MKSDRSETCFFFSFARSTTTTVGNTAISMSSSILILDTRWRRTYLDTKVTNLPLAAADGRRLMADEMAEVKADEDQEETGENSDERRKRPKFRRRDNSKKVVNGNLFTPFKNTKIEMKIGSTHPLFYAMHSLLLLVTNAIKNGREELWKGWVGSKSEKYFQKVDGPGDGIPNICLLPVLWRYPFPLWALL